MESINQKTQDEKQYEQYALILEEMCTEIAGKICDNGLLTVVIFGCWEYVVFLILPVCILNFLQYSCTAFIIKVYFKKKNKVIGFEITYSEVIDRKENGPQD